VSERTEPFSANEWRLFEVWLNYLDKGLSIAYELSQNGEIDNGSFGVSDAVTGVRWYATDLAVLDALVYRATGRRQDESACFDQELSDVFDELDADHPRLRDLRNSVFAHPPFVDRMVGPDEVLFFTTSGVHVAPADGGEPTSSSIRCSCI
jgi:hypothetical protein